MNTQNSDTKGNKCEQARCRKINAFKAEIPEIKELFDDDQVKKRIHTTLISVLTYLEIDNPQEVVKFTLDHAQNYKNVEDYEREVHKLFEKSRITQRIPAKLANRSQLIFEQIEKHLSGHLVLDIGCGDGKVGELVSERGRQIILADTYEHGNVANLQLPFVKIKQNTKIPFDDNTFDTTLLLTVLHHSDDPKQVIEESKRVTKAGGKIIVIESVYGVKGFGGNLTDEEQRKVNIFFDHFYNRVIHYNECQENKVNVPFNFQTPDDWKKFFEKQNLEQETVEQLGFDQPTVPEYHTLHVLRVRK